MTSDPIVRYQTERGARLMQAERLRPMNSNEVLDTALRLYQRHGLTFLRLTAVPSLFCVAAVAFVLSYVFPAFGSTRDASSLAVQAAEVSGTMALAVFIGGPLFLTGLTYATALVVRMVSDSLQGKPADELSAQRDARRILPRLFWLNIRELLLSLSGVIFATAIMLLGAFLTSVTPEDSALPGLIGLLGIFALIGGGLIFLWIISRDALAAPVAVLEGVGGKEASRRSRFLINKPGGQNPHLQRHGSATGVIWSVYLLLLFVTFGMLIALGTIFDLMALDDRLGALLAGAWYRPLIEAAVGVLPFYVLLWLLIPVWACTVTVVYFERRIRLEGFDIEALADQIGGGRASRFNV